MSKKVILSNNYSHNEELLPLINNLPKAFAEGKGELLYDKRNKIRRFKLTSGEVVIVKQYKKPNLFQKLCYSTFWKNKAKKAFLFAERLLNMSIDTPKPIAAVTYTTSIGFVDRYYFVSSEDNRPDCLILRDGEMENPKPLADALMKFIISLHEKGFLHGDTNLSNFLYEQEKDGTYHFAVIDTNRSQFLSHPATEKESLENLVRLTHKRSLLCMLIRSYASQRGWNEQAAENSVLRLIEKREKKKKMLSRLK